MGNPASDKRKKTEKRRKKYEQRLGPGAYLPKEQREHLNAEIEKAVAVATKEKTERDAAKTKVAAEKKAAKPAPAAEKGEKPSEK